MRLGSRLLFAEPVFKFVLRSMCSCAHDDISKSLWFFSMNSNRTEKASDEKNLNKIKHGETYTLFNIWFGNV